MVMYMRYLIFLSFVFLFSCLEIDPLEKKYLKKNLEDDLVELKNVLSKDQLKYLVDYIELMEFSSVETSSETYASLLKKAENTQSIKNINEKLILRKIQSKLKDHNCDEFLEELHKKGIYHSKNQHDSAEIWEDDFFIN